MTWLRSHPLQQLCKRWMRRPWKTERKSLRMRISLPSRLRSRPSTKCFMFLVSSCWLWQSHSNRFFFLDGLLWNYKVWCRSSTKTYSPPTEDRWARLVQIPDSQVQESFADTCGRGSTHEGAERQRIGASRFGHWLWRGRCGDFDWLWLRHSR